MAAVVLSLVLPVLSSCLPKPPEEAGGAGGAQITLYGFSIMKESLEKAIYPAFAAKWKQEHGQDVRFTSSFAGSETITNQILQGVDADIAILSIERDADRLKQGGFVTSDWHGLPQRGIVNKLELGDRIAVLNAGRLEQIGTPDDVYNKPETEYVATFLGAANLLLGVSGAVEIGTASIPAQDETARFREGQAVKLVFRPEDVRLSETGALPEGCRRLTNGIIEEMDFVGAYERLTVRLDLVARSHAEGKPQLYNVTINASERLTGVPIMVTRPKPDAGAARFHVGDRVAVGLMSFRVLPNFALASEGGGKFHDTGK